MENKETSTADAVTVIHATRQRRPGDVVQKNTADLPDHQRKPILWLHAHGHERDMTNKALADLIGYSESTISRIYGERLTYAGDLDEVCKAINEARKRIESEVIIDGNRLPFIPCKLSAHMWTLCRLAQQHQRMLFGYGESQIGKSRSLKELARLNRGEIWYWEMPVGGALSNFLANAAAACGISARAHRGELRRRMIDRFDGSQLIIIDQMHRAFADRHNRKLDTLSNAQLATLDFIIELFDAKNPGIALWGTPVFREGMRDLQNANFFKQLRRRGLNANGFELPSEPLKSDLDTYAQAYGLPPATGAGLKLQSDVIASDGLGMWITRLALAKTRAASQAHRITWTDVIRAHDYIDVVALGQLKEDAAAA
mgnify:CR=1 FL=1